VIASTLVSTPIGVYVHYPYCLQKCPYCDFASYATDRDAAPQAGYADDVLTELAIRGDGLRGRKLETVFFGGGTPSLWEPRELGRALAGIARHFDASLDDVEVTVECNPTSFDEDRARAMIDAGVDRVSIGVQSLDARRLQFLGRLHGPEGGIVAIEQAVRAGMPRVSGDLIYGVEGGSPQRPEDAAREAGRVADAGATHVSAYALTVEPGTRFGELSRRGQLPTADEDVMADAFFAVEAALAERGIARYEVSNHARPGDESRHNLGYWRGLDYLGLGAAAVGTIGSPDGRAIRTKNTVQPRKWSDGVRAGTLVEESREELGPEDRMRERIMLGLRLREGLDVARAGADLGIDPLPAERRATVEAMLRDGRLERAPPSAEEGSERIRVPQARWFLADGIAAALF
jgi:putative oxygen-independent coproporphyrinogen III oxidase